jgi:hypothetical protein
VPRDFFSLVDVVAFPDTQNEYSLGPFNWHNRKSIGGWWPWGTIPGLVSAASRARLAGSTIYCEPSFQAAGSYRMWYCPRPHTPDIIARVATTGALAAYTATPPAVGQTLTGNAVGVLTVDSVAVKLGDIVLVKNETGGNNVNNGVFVCTTEGTAGVAYVLTRDTRADETSECAVGDIVAVGQTSPVLPPGAINDGKFFTLSTFTAIGSAIAYSAGAVLEPIIDQFQEAVMVTCALPALTRDGGTATTSAADWAKQLRGPSLDGNGGLVGEMRAYFATSRAVEPAKTIDTDQIGAGWARGNW